MKITVVITLVWVCLLMIVGCSSISIADRREKLDLSKQLWRVNMGQGSVNEVPRSFGDVNLIVFPLQLNQLSNTVGTEEPVFLAKNYRPVKTLFKSVRFMDDISVTDPKFEQQKDFFLELYYNLLIPERNLSRYLGEASDGQLFLLTQALSITAADGERQDIAVVSHLVDTEQGMFRWSGVVREQGVAAGLEIESVTRLGMKLLDALYHRYRAKKHETILKNLARYAND